jgi:ABC-type xylose transport system permease subunit
MANGCKPIRTLRVITISALLLCGPIGFAFAYVGYWLAKSFVPGFIAAGLLMLTYLVSFIMVAVWPCPQCHKRFVRFNAFWPRSCSHCGQGC